MISTDCRKKNQENGQITAYLYILLLIMKQNKCVMFWRLPRMENKIGEVTYSDGH